MIWKYKMARMQTKKLSSIWYIYLSLAFMQINLLNVALFLKCLARIIKTHLMCEKIGQ